MVLATSSSKKNNQLTATNTPKNKSFIEKVFKFSVEFWCKNLSTEFGQKVLKSKSKIILI